MSDEKKVKRPKKKEVLENKYENEESSSDAELEVSNENLNTEKDFFPYAIYCFGNPSKNEYTAQCLEFPDIEITAKSRSEAISEIEKEIKERVRILKPNEVPEPYFSNPSPKKLEVHVSHNLYRKLSLLSKREKLELDKLIPEILSEGIERREMRTRQSFSQPSSNASNNNNNNHHKRREHHGNRPQHRGGGGRYRDTMENRDNFMEYVRNLEKRGGGGWRK